MMRQSIRKETSKTRTSEHFRASGAHEAALDLSDLFTVSSQGEDIQDLQNGTELY